MKVFVTGAPGFIGSHVVRRLLLNGHTVHAAVRPSTSLARLADVAESIEWMHCDLTDSDRLRTLVLRVRPDACTHLAWYAEPGQYLRSTENLRMLVAGIELARTLADSGCSRLLATGTCFEYDTEQGYLSESTPTRPVTLYAATKLALHLALDRFSHTVGMPVVWARIFYLYGPQEDERRLVPTVIRTLAQGRQAELTSGEQVRDYLHVADVASAITTLLETDAVGAVNVGSGQPVTVRHVAEVIGRTIGRTDLLAFGARAADPDDPPFICANSRQLRESTSWTPAYTLERGIQDTVAWWRTATSIGEVL
jgi:nucleoside-diphosphate-sugar epimerase